MVHDTPPLHYAVGLEDVRQGLGTRVGYELASVETSVPLGFSRRKSFDEKWCG